MTEEQGNRKVEDGTLPEPQSRSKWMVRLVVVMLLLPLFLIGLLQIPFIQDWVLNRFTSFLSNKMETRVEASHLDLSIFKGLVLESFYIEDNETQDTLLFSEKLEVNFDRNLFSLVENALHLNDVRLTNARIHLTKRKGETSNNLILLLSRLSSQGDNKSEEGNPFDFRIKGIGLDDVHYTSVDHNLGMSQSYYIDEGNITFQNIDLKNNNINIREIAFLRPIIRITKMATEEMIIEDNGVIEPIIKEIKEIKDSMTVNVEALSVLDAIFSYNDYRKSAEDKYDDVLDYSHFELSKLDFDVQGFLFTDGEENGFVSNFDIKKLSFEDDKKFTLNSLMCDSVVVNKNSISLPDFKFITENSSVSNKLIFKFREFEDFSSFEDKIILQSDLTGTKLAIKDLMHFAGKLNGNSFFTNNKSKIVQISGRYYGTVNNIAGRDVDITMGRSLLLKGNFNTRNITNSDEALVNLSITELKTSMSSLNKLLPNFTPPSNFYKLGNIDFSGRFDGYFQDFVAYGTLQSALGSAEMDMRLDVKDGSSAANYSGEINLQNFDLGAWSDNADFGIVNFISKVENGFGLTQETASADISASVQSLSYKNYVYKDFIMDGRLEQNKFDGLFTISDTNIDLVFDGFAAFEEGILNLNFTAQINQLDLVPLNLSNDPLAFTGNLKINTRGSNINNVIGNIEARDLIIMKADTSYLLDSIDINIQQLNENNKLMTVSSENVNAKIEGEYDLINIVKSVKKILRTNYPYHTKQWKSSDYADVSRQTLRFDVSIGDSKNLFDLIGVRDFRVERFKAKGTIDNKVNELALASSIPFLNYKNNEFFGGQILMSSLGTSGDVLVNVDSLYAGGRSYNPIDLQTRFSGDEVLFEFATDNIVDSLEKLDIRGKLIPHEMGYELNLEDKELVMLGESWNIYSDNAIVIGDKYIDILEFRLSDGFREINLRDIDNKGLELRFNRFNFGTINGIIDYDKMDFTGEGDLRFKVNDLYNIKESSVSANMYIFDFNINNDSWGTLEFDLTKYPNKPYEAIFSLGVDNQVIKANVIYDADKDYFTSTVKAKGVPINFMEYLITTGLSETQGTAVVDGRVEGPISNLKIYGDATIYNGGMKVDYLGTKFFFDNQSLKLTENFIDLSDAIITDTQGNEGKVTGGLRHNYFRDFRLAANISADDAIILNTTKADNPFYFGFGKGEVSVDFSGPFDRTNMDITAITGPETVLNIPLEETQLTADQSFIEYVSRSDLFNPQAETNQREFKIEGLDITMNLVITEDASINLIFNEALGDIIKGQGRGNLQVYIRRSGDFNIYGDYEIEQGEYLFTALGLIAKPFTVRRGGLIKWTGDPINAVLDIEADYAVRSPLNVFLADYFISDQIANEARNKTQVDLVLKLGGTLYSPIVTFDLNFPDLTGELKTFADSKLRSLRTNQIALNSQVAGLLVFNTFLPSNDLVSSLAGSDIQNTGISTLSEFVSSQLSLLVSGLINSALTDNGFISGVDFEIGLRKNSSFYGETQNEGTLLPDEIEVNLKNRFAFLDERLSLNVGGNYVRENYLGDGNYIIGDFALEYFLTNDRKLKVRMYGKYDRDQIDFDRRKQKYGLGLGYRTEFGTIETFKKKLSETLKDEPSIKDSTDN